MSKTLTANETLGVVVRRERVVDSQSPLIQSTILGTLLGFIAGAINGGILLVYVPEMGGTWAEGAVTLLVCALGWAMYGAIIGGSGILARGAD
jgi:hypothetical protein